MVPSPRFHRLELAWPKTWPLKSMTKPGMTLVKVCDIETESGPLAEAGLNSSAPMEGGLSQASPSISTPLVAAALPAARQGDPAEMWKESAKSGSLLILFAPLVASGAVSQ